MTDCKDKGAEGGGARTRELRSPIQGSSLSTGHHCRGGAEGGGAERGGAEGGGMTRDVCHAGKQPVHRPEPPAREGERPEGVAEGVLRT